MRAAVGLVHVLFRELEREGGGAVLTCSLFRTLIWYDERPLQRTLIGLATVRRDRGKRGGGGGWNRLGEADKERGRGC